MFPDGLADELEDTLLPEEPDELPPGRLDPEDVEPVVPELVPVDDEPEPELEPTLGALVLDEDTDDEDVTDGGPFSH